MSSTLLLLGIACVIAAVVGGGLKAVGFEFPGLSSIPRQILLAIVGIILIFASTLVDTDTDPERKIFQDPTIDGYRLDWCYYAGEGCGEGAAEVFCARQGYDALLDFDDDPNVGAQGIQTKLIGSEEICNTEICDSFASITCIKY